ncbi:acyltransferase [Thermococcus sp.]|uniref:acyltransferase n=1 Tax=Thermococcus sp. TaxID=35749 RepID=UPI002621681D|nr:acyltransferase [Thermococcus sp.]
MSLIEELQKKYQDYSERVVRVRKKLEQKGVFIHPNALVESEHVGEGTRIWAFAHVLPGAKIGKNCNICDHVFVENDVIVGDNVTIKNGVQLWDGVRIEDNVFVGPNVTFTNDLRPRSKVYPPEFIKTYIKEGASIGANATIVCGVTIGRWAMIGAGSVVTRDVPDYALVYGVPARLRGWVCECGRDLEFNEKGYAKCVCGKEYKKIIDETGNEKVVRVL